MSRRAIESCTFHLQSWRPFSKTLDCDSPKSLSSTATTAQGPHSKRPCRSDRATSFSIDAILDMSKLSLFDDDRHKRWFVRKRRRRGGSRSVSGRSSDRRCCSIGASAANGTCSDFPMAVATDSSGELFVNGGGEVNWGSDASEATTRNPRRETRESSNCGGEIVIFDGVGNDSGYGSEPGYRGDEELGYGDEVDEEEDDLWGERFRDNTSNSERVGENSLQKAHHRCRRKKQDLRMVVA